VASVLVVGGALSLPDDVAHDARNTVRRRALRPVKTRFIEDPLYLLMPTTTGATGESGQCGRLNGAPARGPQAW